MIRLFLFLILISYNAHAKDLIALTRGDTTCTKFIMIQNQNGELYVRYKYWLGGFVTGFNAAIYGNIGRGINQACWLRKIREYCKAYPDWTLAIAINKIMFDMQDRKKFNDECGLPFLRPITKKTMARFLY